MDGMLSQPFRVQEAQQRRTAESIEYPAQSQGASHGASGGTAGAATAGAASAATAGAATAGAADGSCAAGARKSIIF